MQLPDSNERPPTWSESGDELLDAVSTHALFILDADGEITRWSGPAQSLYGYRSPQILGQHVRTLLADEEGNREDGSPAAFLTEGKEGPVEVEHWHERADGSVFWGSLALSPQWGEQFQGYVAVCQDTTVTKEYQQMLERQNDRLKEFTDILAHDLRNPLNVITSHLELYEETGNQEHLESIEETTDRMTRLLEDLLRVARQGGVVETPEPTDIGQVVDTAWEGTGATAEATLVYERVPTLSADPDRLCELFENLFRNSVEHNDTDNQSVSTDVIGHTPDGVTVTVGPLENGFSVEDDGPGIPTESRDDIFDHGFTTATDGSGYGLSVVRTIVNAHGWDIDVGDTDTGGARFDITNIEFLD